MAGLDKKNVRYNILSILVYIIGIILIIQLFNLQIVHGEEYLEKANSRLTREVAIKAARGNILDCNGNLLAGNQIRYSLKIYKSKIEEKDLNTTILNTINILEKNGDTYNEEFPISINPIKYKYQNQDNITKWIEENDLQEGATAEQALNYYIKEYGLENYRIEDARKIIGVRYGIEKKRIYKYERIRNFSKHKRKKCSTVRRNEQ